MNQSLYFNDKIKITRFRIIILVLICGSLNRFVENFITYRSHIEKKVIIYYVL